MLLQANLQKLGHSCLSAEDGAEAWELYQENEVEVIITDMVMPGMDGIELCRRVRGFTGAKSPYTYFIFLTAISDQKNLLQAMHIGADDYLSKPLNFDELKVRLLVAERITALHQQLTEQKLEVEQLNERLERRVKERTEQLQATNRQLEEAALEQGRSQAALKESEDRFRQMAELSPEGIFIHVQGKIVFANKAFARLVGAETPEQLFGKATLEMAPPEDLEIIRERIGRLEQWGEKEGVSNPFLELKLYRLDGSLIEVEIASAFLRFKNMPAIQVMVRDISFRKQLEEGKRRNFQREKDLAEFKSDFITLTSHEFRTPLSIILGSTEFLEHYGHKIGEEKKVAYFQRIKGGVRNS